jgi:membrane-associated phospholipid phosphatase
MDNFKRVHLSQLLMRILATIVLIGAASLYIPLNHNLAGGIDIAVRFDALIPLWPVWVLPYLAAFPFWGISLMWAVFSLDPEQFLSFFTADLAIVLTAMLVFFTFPTYVIRPNIPGNGIPEILLGFVYRMDGAYNAFPSGHIYQTGFFCLYYSRLYPKLNNMWLMLFLLIGLSTLFTHQHVVADVVGGMLFASVGYWLSTRLEKIFRSQTVG